MSTLSQAMRMVISGEAFKEEHFISNPQRGPEVLLPPRTAPAAISKPGEPLKLGHCIIRTCTTCDCYREGYCWHVSHFKEYGSPQWIGSFHQIADGFNPEACPLSKDENGNWIEGGWHDYGKGKAKWANTSST